MTDLKNPWIPIPQFSIIEEEEKNEKILKEIPENILQINLNSCNYDKKDSFILINLDLGDEKKISEWVYIQEFPKILSWTIEKNDLCGLNKRFLEFSLYRTQ